VTSRSPAKAGAQTALASASTAADWTPAFAGEQIDSPAASAGEQEYSPAEKITRAPLPSARSAAGEGEAARVSAVPHRPESAGRASSSAAFIRPAAMLAACLSLAACATQTAAVVKPAAPGFLLGLWHGFIFPAAFILSLFMKDVAVYAVPNDGLLYNLGFFIGIVFVGVGARGSHVVYRTRVVREQVVHTRVIDQ
jgi:hypothetical protein